MKLIPNKEINKYFHRFGECIDVEELWSYQITSLFPACSHDFQFRIKELASHRGPGPALSAPFPQLGPFRLRNSATTYQFCKFASGHLNMGAISCLQNETKLRALNQVILIECWYLALKQRLKLPPYYVVCARMLHQHISWKWTLFHFFLLFCHLPCINQVGDNKPLNWQWIFKEL